MSAHVLFNLLNKFGEKRSNARLAEHFISFLATSFIYRGSNMSAHVLLNVLNKLGKRDKIGGLPSFLSHFCYEFN